MNNSNVSETATLFCRSFPLWLRWCSFALFLSSVVILSVSILAYRYNSIFAASLVPGLVIALSAAILLNVYCFSFLRKERQEADQAFRDTDREFSSIFQNVLDGVLIVDNAGECLDANPAAEEILRCPQHDLIGGNISRFFSDPSAFAARWTAFLQVKNQRGRAQLVAGNGIEVIVDFTAAANYLPDRHILIICDVTERTKAEKLLQKSEERFQHMADNIQEIFWMMDAATQEVLYVNPAYATITGHSVERLRTNPSSYRELIHPEDRVRVISRLNETLISGALDEEFRFTRADGTVRWIWAKGFPVPSGKEIVGTAQDITSRKQAEMKIAEQLDAVEAARAEAEALRKATLALSQNLAMDSVLDTLLQCIGELVPFDRASVLFVEDAAHVMVAREAAHSERNRAGLVLSALENVFLQKILFEHKAITLPDTAKEADWRDAPPFDHTRSWLGIPLIAAGTVIGVLSLSARTPATFTTEHLRVAKNLAVSAAVAIQNARVHERAAIYAAELEARLRDGSTDYEVPR
jgi:PAS domain S-box-containing protein